MLTVSFYVNVFLMKSEISDYFSAIIIVKGVKLENNR